MFSALPTASLRISELLAPPFRFSIPPYQRPYSWTTREAGQLLEDVLAASGAEDDIAADPDYFFGTILLLDASGDESPIGSDPWRSRGFEIVDGQQRLVTLTILACVLRDLERGAGEEIDARLDRLVASPADERTGSPRRHRITLRGREHQFLADHVQSPGGCASQPDHDALSVGEAAILDVRQHFLSELANLDAQARRALSAYLCERCHVVVILTRDVDRAHRMFMVLNERGKPLMRNDILKAEVMRGVTDADSARVTEIWDGLAALLGSEFEAFFSHVRFIHGHTRPQVIAAVRQLVRERGDPRAFIEDDLAPLALAFRAIMDAGSAFSSLPPETDRRLYYLKRLKGTDWVPPAIMVLDRYKDDPAQARRLIGEIDRLAHLLRLMCLGTGKRTRRFAAVVQAIRDGSALAPEAPCFQLSREEMRSITFNLKDIYGRAPLFSKLVLMRLGDVLDGRLAPLEPGDVTVEHVMPQRPGQHSDWRRTIADPELREAATKSIGNLAVVPQAVNDRARNQEFDRKRELYASSHPMPPLLAEIAAAPEWTLEVIKSREDRLLGALAALWRLDVKGAALPG